MTGARISGEEAYLVGLATHYVASGNIDALAHRLSTLPAESALNPSLVSQALHEFDADPLAANETLAKSAFFGDRRIALDYVFGQLSCESIFSCLDEIAAVKTDSQAAVELAELGLAHITPEVQAWAQQTLKDLKTKSPRALKITHQAILERGDSTSRRPSASTCASPPPFATFPSGATFYTGVTHVLERDPATGKRRTGIAAWDPRFARQGLRHPDPRPVLLGPRHARKPDCRWTCPSCRRSRHPPPPKSPPGTRQPAEGKGPLRWEQSHNVFALPSEAECAALLEGNHPRPQQPSPGQRRAHRLPQAPQGHLPGLEFKVADWIKRSHRSA